MKGNCSGLHVQYECKARAIAPTPKLPNASCLMSVQSLSPTPSFPCKPPPLRHSRVEPSPPLRHSRAGGNLCFVLNAALDSRLRGNDGIYLSALYCRRVPPFCPIHFWCFLRLLRSFCALCVLPPCCNALCGALCVCLATGFVRLAALQAIGGVIRVAIRCSFRVVAASLRCRRFAGIV